MQAIEVENLSKSYGDIRALADVSFSVGAGEIVGLLGPNGAGKTTLMKILTGYVQPDAGGARIDGLDVVASPRPVQERIGYLPENAPLYREMSVQEYLLMMAALRNIPLAQARSLVIDAVRATGLQDHMVQQIGTLSKGYRQRVGIAQAILHRPKVLILDEPTTGLDPTQIVEIRGLIRRLAAETTVVLSTHILPEVELTCERVLMIARGQLRTSARMDELRIAHGALVSLGADHDEAKAALERIPGVKSVEDLGLVDGWRRYRLSAPERSDLCPAIYDLARDQGWRISELRPDARSLEDAFRRLSEPVEAGELKS